MFSEKKIQEIKEVGSIKHRVKSKIKNRNKKNPKETLFIYFSIIRYSLNKRRKNSARKKKKKMLSKLTSSVARAQIAACRTQCKILIIS